MPAPDDLKTQSPGEPLGTMTPLASAITGDNTTTTDTQAALAQAPLYVAKHNGGGRWKIWQVLPDSSADWFSDFMAVGDGAKEQAEVEAQRLNDGGEPLKLDPQRNEDRAALAQAQPSTPGVDPTTLKQAVMTPDGWLCPEPPVKE